MKTCALCGATAEASAETCAACGEATFVDSGVISVSLPQGDAVSVAGVVINSDGEVTAARDRRTGPKSRR